MADYSGISHQSGHANGRGARNNEYDGDISSGMGSRYARTPLGAWHGGSGTGRREEPSLYPPNSAAIPTQRNRNDIWGKASDGMPLGTSPGSTGSIPDRSQTRFRDSTPHSQSDAHTRDASPYFPDTYSGSPANTLVEPVDVYGEPASDYIDRGRATHLNNDRSGYRNGGLDVDRVLGTLPNSHESDHRSRMSSSFRGDVLNPDSRGRSLPPQPQQNSFLPYSTGGSDAFQSFQTSQNLQGVYTPPRDQTLYDAVGYEDAALASQFRGMGLDDENEQARRPVPYTSTFGSNHQTQNPYSRVDEPFKFPRPEASQQNSLSQNLWGKPDPQPANDRYFQNRGYSGSNMPQSDTYQSDQYRNMSQSSFYSNGNGLQMPNSRLSSQQSFNYPSNIPIRDLSAYSGYDSPMHQQSYGFNPMGGSRMPSYPTTNAIQPPAPQAGPPKRTAPDEFGGVRSSVLEAFRTDSKTKRYELKDIYNYVVEFSGDQHGSRFIQQKLETANSDEKDVIFAELAPNAIQLMTDVFGNYVIQKFFEHGNQLHKTALANTMQGHVLSLSLQMYGCRVVQKSIEHVLVEQQASIVKELEGDVLKCVKDQNGNHVIQKAIERVPAVHIGFILKAFHGQVQQLATHPYGCRVIQRMLEHCSPEAQSDILRELRECTYTLVQDQYGNYVTQHVIEHGNPDDKARIIKLVVENLLQFSKHKFASNVVEKSIEYSSDDQRRDILKAMLTAGKDGQTPLQVLVRDQFGNYVIQKMLNTLHGADKTKLISEIRPSLQNLKRYVYGKQINAIEKMITDSMSRPNSPLAGTNTPSPIFTAGIMSPPESASDAPSPREGSADTVVPAPEKK